jgi:glycosyltransferase involved in cell wall biosynthesis
MSELAIVIPAYKDMFFEKTLLSISNQTCKEFTLYIGNDSSPYNLEQIVDSFRDRINIVYKHFDINQGGKDLVAQWERCIDLVGKEDWIWLFSDDDIMGPNCVENFYRTLDENPDFDLFHFDVTHIDERRNINHKITNFPSVLTSEEFFNESLRGSYSFVVEYIFRKSHFYEMDRFQKFDLAWFSDTATWIKLAKKHGIKNIDNADVFFRTSDYNITPNYQDKDIVSRKFRSQIEFACWISDQVQQNEIHLEIVHVKKLLCPWFYNAIRWKVDYISFKLLPDLLNQFHIKVNQHKCPEHIIIIFYFYKIYRSVVEKIKWSFQKSSISVKK